MIHTRDPEEQRWFLDRLGTHWFLDQTLGTAPPPSGYEKPLYIGNLPGPSAAEIGELARQYPGAVWYILGEPNRRYEDGYVDASSVVEQLHDLYAAIRAADPTARIASPSVLNWEFTCYWCPGYRLGRDWVDEFRFAWRARYGTEPPIDIWSIDVYPLDWRYWEFPMTDWRISIEQLAEMQDYLDAIPEHRDKPMWVMELGLHWGWDAWDWEVEGCVTPAPSGTYQTAQVIEYLRRVYDWLEANSGPGGFERWVTFVTWRDISRCSNDAYAGLSLFDGPAPGAALTEVGEYFRDRVYGVAD